MSSEGISQGCVELPVELCSCGEGVHRSCREVSLIGNDASQWCSW